MKLFICWSERRGRAVAECLANALKEDPLRFDVGMSPDIAKGAVWFQEITSSLNGVDAGIVVMTPESLDSPWLHFEAGLLAAKFNSGGDRRPRIYPYLLHPEPLEVRGPLGQYQLTVATGEDTCALVRQLLDDRAEDAHWNDPKIRESWWAGLAADLQQHAATQTPSEVAPGLADLFRRKTFLEPVQRCVAQSWLERYSGACSTLEALRRLQPRVHRQCRPYARILLEQLIQATDGYAMAMGALLLKEVEFNLDSQGELVVFPPGIQDACESRRIEALRLQQVLMAEAQAPVCEEAAEFEGLDSFALKKDIVHRLEAELRRPWESASPLREWWRPMLRLNSDSRPRAATSRWTLDRILYYLDLQRAGNVSLIEAIRHVWKEWEKVHSQGNPGASRMALHYALEVLEEVLARQEAPLDDRSRNELGRLFHFLDDLERRIEGSRISQRVRELRSRIAVPPAPG